MTRPALILYAALALCAFACKGGGDSPVGKPDTNGILAYEAGSELHLQATDGSKAVCLTSTWRLESPCRPVFSPDGRKLLFGAMESGVRGLYLYDITTGELPVCIAQGHDGRFSEDGASVVYSKGGQIALLDLASGRSSVLTFDAAAANSEPALSPDGKTVVYASGGRIIRLEVESLSSSTLLTGESSLSCPVFCGTRVVCEARGQGILVDGKLVFKGGHAPVPAFGDWVVFEHGGEAMIGNVKTGESYAMEIHGLSRPGFSSKPVEIAQPADGGKPVGPGDTGDNITSDTERPALKGRLVYHNYTSYDSMDSKMYIYDFSDDSLTEISRNWTTVSSPMNGHFSTDGKWLTFMGTGQATGSWDIFLWEIGSSTQPVNLTPEGSYRDEDPKFSFDGSKICFKRNEHLCEYYVATSTLKVVTKGDDDAFGQPYYSVDGNKVLFGGGSGSGSYIGLYDLTSNTSKVLYDKAGTVEYYPITIDETSFYYTQNYSATNKADQLFKGYFNGSASKSLPFNASNADYSDAYPISSGWLFLVSTRGGGKGQYDLYIANETSGTIYSLNTYNTRINTSLNELGPAYTSVR